MIVNNLHKFIEYKGISIAAFEKRIGMSNNSFRKSLNNNGAIGSDKLENILKEFPELNSEWLLTGEGNMLKSSEQQPESKQNLTERLISIIESQQRTIELLSKK